MLLNLCSRLFAQFRSGTKLLIRKIDDKISRCDNEGEYILYIVHMYICEFMAQWLLYSPCLQEDVGNFVVSDPIQAAPRKISSAGEQISI